ncbi:glycosyltransferase [Acetobacteraceae bacterium H6797]|nr:glycosyltransferase [Acetobacteraceae bacterium H6797]
MPLVTVIVPNYNHRPYLAERLDSLFAQRFEDYEVLLLDDASTDESPAFLATYRDHPKVSGVILNSENSGNTFHQWKKGIAAAKGRYIWLAESDDRTAPTLLPSLVAKLEADPSCVLAYCQSRRIDKDGQVIGDWRGWTEPLAPGLYDRDFDMDGAGFAERLLLHRNVIPNASAVLFRRDAYLASGEADPSIRYCGDWFVWLKLAMQGRIAFHAQALNDFRQHDKSVIATRRATSGEIFRKKYDLIMRQAFDRHLDGMSGPGTDAVRRKNRALLRQEAASEGLLLARHKQAEAAAYFAMARDGAPAGERLALSLRRLWAGLRGR